MATLNMIASLLGKIMLLPLERLGKVGDTLLSKHHHTNNRSQSEKKHGQPWQWHPERLHNEACRLPAAQH